MNFSLPTFSSIAQFFMGAKSQSEDQAAPQTEQTAYETLKEFADQYISQGNLKDPNPINAKINFRVRANLPGHAIVDGGHFWHGVTGDYQSIYPQSILASGGLTIAKGLLQLPRNTEIVSVDTLKIYPSDPYAPFPTIEGRSIDIRSDGTPRLRLYDAFTGVIIPPHRPLENWAWQMPIGKTPEGQAIFDEADLGTNESFDLARYFRRVNLPELLSISALLVHAAQSAGVTPAMRPDPELTIKLPEDPRELISEISVDAQLDIPAQLILPGIGTQPGVIIKQKEGATLSLHLDGSNQMARNDAGKGNLQIYMQNASKSWDELQNWLLASYAFITFSDQTGNHTFPLSYFDPNKSSPVDSGAIFQKWGSKQEIWERIKADSYLTQDGDVRTKYCDDGKPSIRLTAREPLASFDVSVDIAKHHLKFVKLDGQKEITLPLTSNFVAKLSGHGPADKIDLKKWVLRAQLNGTVDIDGTIDVPSLTIDGHEFPGIHIPPTPGSHQGIVSDGFDLDVRNGQLEASGRIIGDIDAASVSFTPPGEFWNKLGLGAIPAMGRTEGHFEAVGSGQSVTLKASGKTQNSLPLPLLQEGITIQKIGAELEDFWAKASLDKDGILKTEASLDANFNLEAQLKDLALYIESARVGISDAFVDIDPLTQTLYSQSRFHAGIEHLEGVLPFMRFALEGTQLEGEMSLSGPVRDLSMGLATYLKTTLLTPFAEIKTEATLEANVAHLNSGATQNLAAILNFTTGFFDPKNPDKKLGDFSGDMEVSDRLFASSEGDIYQRQFSFPTMLGHLMGISHSGFTVRGEISQGRATSIREGDQTRENIPSGIRFNTQVEGNELAKQVLGPLSEASLNLQLSKTQISFAGATLNVSGQLIGRVKLVNISTDPLKPEFRPQPGFTFEVRHANIVAHINGKKTVIRGLVRITEHNGVIKITGQQTIPGEDGNKTIIRPYASIKLEDSAKKYLEVDGTPVAYYDPKAIQNLPVAFSLRVLNSNLAKVITEGSKELVATGWAKVKDVFGDLTFTFGVQSDMGNRKLKFLTQPELVDASKSGGIEAAAKDLAKAFEVELKEGGLAIQGSSNEITTTLKIPDTNFTQRVSLPDGSWLDLAGHFTVENKLWTKVNPKSFAVKVSQDPIHISGFVDVTPFNADGTPNGAKSRVALDFFSDVKIDPKVDKQNQKVSVGIDIAHTELSAKITEALCLGPISLCPDSQLIIPIEKMGGFINIDLKKKSIQGEWAFGNIRVDLTAPGSPLALAQVPLKGDLDAQIIISNPNKINFSGDLNKGLQVSFTDHPILTTILASVGKDLKIDLSTEISADKLAATINPQGKVHIDLADFVHKTKLDGLVMLEGTQLNLSDIVVSNLVKKGSIDFDPVNQTISLKVDAQYKAPSLSPPETMNDWLEWSTSNWVAYRKELNAPERQFLAVITESLAKLPGVSVPPGKGKIYVAFNKTEFSVKLSDFDKPEDALKKLMEDAGSAVAAGMIREYPIPTDEMVQQYHEQGGSEIVYNDQQNPEGTFFVLGDSDTTQLVLNNLGLSGRILGNKRIDMGDFGDATILGRYFKKSLPQLIHALKEDDSIYFTNWPIRALTIMGRLNTDKGLIEKLAIYRNHFSRASSFINNDYESTRGILKGEQHINLTSVTYLDQASDEVQKSLADFGKLKKSLHWFPNSSSRPIQTSAKQDGEIWVTHVTATIDESDPVMTHAASRLMVLPLVDNKGNPHSVLIHDMVLGLTGDYGFLDGQSKDFGREADPLLVPGTTWFLKDPPTAKTPSEAPPPTEEPALPCDRTQGTDTTEPETEKAIPKPVKKTVFEILGINMRRMPSMQDRAHPQPTTDPIPPVVKGLMTGFINRVIHHANTGRWAKAAPIYSVPGLIEGIQIPPEYLSIDFNKKDSTGAEGIMTLSVGKETNVNLAKEMLVKGFGLSDSEALGLIPTASDPVDDRSNHIKEVSLKTLFDKSSLATQMEYDEFIRFSKDIVAMHPLIKGRFRSHGTIYLTMLNDIREQVSKMSEGEFRFTSFNHPMFIGDFGPIKEQRTDLAVNSMYFIVRGNSRKDVRKLVQALGTPEDFDLYHKSYSAGSNRVDPSKDDLSQVPENLKSYYDCTQAETEGYYCNEAILNAGVSLHHRIKVPKEIIDGEPACWDLMLLPGKDLSQNGMFSNSGEWDAIQLKGGKILGFNLRMLNTSMDNEEAVQTFAFGQMAGFLTGVIKHALDKTIEYTMIGTTKFKN